MRQQRNVHIACEQALRGTLEAGREKEGELATTYLEFKYLLDMLIGGDDISNETSLPLARFFNVCSHSHSFPLRADWRKSDSSGDASGGATGELEVEFNFQRCSCTLSFVFAPRRQSAPKSLLAGYVHKD